MSDEASDEVTDFGDFEPDDAYDTAPADPFQVALKLHALRYAENLERVEEWDDLSEFEKIARVVVIKRLLEWLRVQGAT